MRFPRLRIAAICLCICLTYAVGYLFARYGAAMLSTGLSVGSAFTDDGLSITSTTTEEPPPSKFDITEEFAFHLNELNYSAIDWFHLYIEPHRYKWIYIPEDFCTTRYPNIKILIVIHTAPDHFNHRQSFREMYGDKFYNKLGVVTLFTLGKSTDPKLQGMLESEAKLYRDIIQQDFWDNYYSISYKAIMWLRFVKEYCSKVEYVFKIDDDLLINIFMLINLMKEQEAKPDPGMDLNRTITCCVFDYMPILREPNSKWYVSVYEDGGGQYYSRYCSGIAYIFPGPLACALFDASSRALYHKIDDFFVTGRLPLVAGNVTYKDISKLALNHDRTSDRELFLNQTVAIQVTANRNQAISMWKELLDKKYKSYL